MKRFPWRIIALAASGLYACSFQDFEYLRDGIGVAGKSSDAGSGGNAAGTGGVPEEGGKPGGGSGGTAGDAGAAGAPEAGSGGAGGDTSEGGAAGSEGGTGDSGADAGGAVGTAGTGGTGGASPTGGTGGTAGTGSKVLLNPSFEQGLVGWTVDPPEAVSKRYVYTQAPTTGSTTVDGSILLATWHELDEYQLSVSQTLTDLEDGTYTFKGNFSSTQSRGAYLFARNCGGEERQEIIETTAFTWFEEKIAAIEVTGGSCEVGLHIHNGPSDWLNADMFFFTKDVEE